MSKRAELRRAQRSAAKGPTCQLCERPATCYVVLFAAWISTDDEGEAYTRTRQAAVAACGGHLNDSHVAATVLPALGPDEALDETAFWHSEQVHTLDVAEAYAAAAQLADEIAGHLRHRERELPRNAYR